MALFLLVYGALVVALTFVSQTLARALIIEMRPLRSLLPVALRPRHKKEG